MKSKVKSWSCTDVSCIDLAQKIQCILTRSCTGYAGNSHVASPAKELRLVSLADSTRKHDIGCHARPWPPRGDVLSILGVPWQDDLSTSGFLGPTSADSRSGGHENHTKQARAAGTITIYCNTDMDIKIESYYCKAYAKMTTIHGRGAGWSTEGGFN